MPAVECTPEQARRWDEHLALSKQKSNKPGRKLSPDKKAGIIKLIKKGWSTSAIKRAIHSSELTINRLRKQVEQGAV